MKVFDNLYFVGQTEYSAWAVTTSDGIIIIDAIFNYSVEDEIVNGLTKLGLEPTKIKYVLVSHGHSDPRRRCEVPTGAFWGARHLVSGGLGASRAQHRRVAKTKARHDRD